MRERSGAGVTERQRPPKAAGAVASGASATVQSGVGAEPSGRAGEACWAATRSLQSGRGAAHSVDAANGLVGGWWRLSDI